jgi:enhancing lycopene biosynthesis protein 2
MSKKILVVLAGCGAKDGSEIRESVLVLLAIDKAGALYQCAAPNKNQYHTLNFLTDEEMPEPRNILIESARIARGRIEDLAQVSMNDYDALILPGGYGAAKNLCTFASDGAKASIDPEVDRIINEAYDQRKPIGAICIAPVLVALALHKKNPNIILTLGTDPSTNANLEKIGVKSKSCLTTAFVRDDKNLIASSPAYMHGSSRISELEQGISQCVNAVIEMCHQKAGV